LPGLGFHPNLTNRSVSEFGPGLDRWRRAKLSWEIHALRRATDGGHWVTTSISHAAGPQRPLPISGRRFAASLFQRAKSPTYAPCAPDALQTPFVIRKYRGEVILGRDSRDNVTRRASGARLLDESNAEGSRISQPLCRGRGASAAAGGLGEPAGVQGVSASRQRCRSYA